MFLFSCGTYQPWHINHPGKPFSDNCFKLDSEQSLNLTSGESSIVKITVLELSVLLAKIVPALCTSPDVQCTMQTCSLQALLLSVSHSTNVSGLKKQQSVLQPEN